LHNSHIQISAQQQHSVAGVDASQHFLAPLHAAGRGACWPPQPSLGQAGGQAARAGSLVGCNRTGGGVGGQRSRVGVRWHVTCDRRRKDEAWLHFACQCHRPSTMMHIPELPPFPPLASYATHLKE
jgi:hypothetical protein